MSLENFSSVFYFLSYYITMNSCELINLISMLTCLIVQNYDENEIALLAAIFVQLGDSLATYLANEDLFEQNCKNSNQNID